MRTGLLLASLVVAAALSANAAYACKGQTETFSANLNDEDGLTALFGEWEIGDGKATAKIAKGKIGIATFSDDITDGEVDLCLTFKSIKENGDNGAAAITFWEDTGDLRYLAMVFSKRGTAYISTQGAKGWKNVTGEKKVPYKKGQENTLRVTLKGTEGLAYLNDMQFAKFKRKDALDSFTVGIAFQDGDWEATKFAGTSVDE